MGLFDSVIVHCPHCDEPTEIQSKAGECSLTNYSLNTAPPAIIDAIMDNVYDCDYCLKPLVVRAKIVTTSHVEKYTPEYEEERSN